MDECKPLIGGREIATVRLANPVPWRDWLIPAIEVPMPKVGQCRLTP